MTSSNRPPSVETPATASNSFNTKYVAGTPEVSSTKTTFEIKQTHLYFSGKIKTETSTLGQLHELRTEDERYLTITVDMTSAKFVLNKIPQCSTRPLPFLRAPHAVQEMSTQTSAVLYCCLGGCTTTVVSCYAYLRRCICGLHQRYATSRSGCAVVEHGCARAGALSTWDDSQLR